MSSGGPPHHPHNRQVPGANLSNAAWNHRLQIPNYFPRQPQLAHMSNEHSLLHQTTWHTPTSDTLKIHPPPHVLSEMFKNESLFPRDCVDLSLARNGNQNGEVRPAPISLSVRDTNKINSLPPSALEIQAVERTKSTSPVAKPTSPAIRSTSPGTKPSSPGLHVHHLKSNSPSLMAANAAIPCIFSSGPGQSLIATTRLGVGKSLSPTPKSVSPGLKLSLGIQGLPPSTTVTMDVVKSQQKRSNVRVDSILERLNPQAASVSALEEKIEPPTIAGVIVPPTSSFDDNSNSSSIINVPHLKDDDTVSVYSNEDSLDSTKCRRKRKPSKTVRVSKDDEKTEDMDVGTITFPIKEKDPISIMGEMLEENQHSEKEGQSPTDLEALIPAKARRKTSSESETIDDIAAMVQEGLKEKEQKQQKEKVDESKMEPQAKPISSVSVIKSKENLTELLSGDGSTLIITPPLPAKKITTNFVEVENKLQEMFAGIEDSGTSDPIKCDDSLDIDDSKTDDPLAKLDDSIPKEKENQETVALKSETSEGTTKIEDAKLTIKKAKRKAATSTQISAESTPKKKKVSKVSKSKIGSKGSTKKVLKQKAMSKVEAVKDVYAYDSGSNTSSTKSRGPFIQIKGPRESPLSVNVVNSSVNDEDGERKLPKSKKFHDDIEYRHKVRSKGLHSSTLSNKYDAQTKDATWICAFCKRGPHATELSGPTHDRSVIPPGDLFGPYFITTQCPEFERRLDDPYDRQFKSKKITRALDADAAPKGGKKTKRKQSDGEGVSENDPDIYSGITETGNRTYEIWAHEDCIVWSQGTYLIGPKIVGLEEAVWTCCNVTCKSCHLKGANISCLRRGCLNVMHICCARSNDWQFLQTNFKAYCPEHQVP